MGTASKDQENTKAHASDAVRQESEEEKEREMARALEAAYTMIHLLHSSPPPPSLCRSGPIRRSSTRQIRTPNRFL